MTGWVSPLPDAARTAVQVYRPGHDRRRLAGIIVERAWRRQGVRVYVWPDGTVAVAVVGSHSDAVLLRECIDQLWATYARHDLLGKPGNGPTFSDVFDQLRRALGRVA